MVFTTLFLFTSIISFTAYAGYIAIEKGRSYIGKGKKLSKLEDSYEQLRSTRREMLQHYYQAKSNGERQREKAIELEIVKVDEEMEELKQEFELLQQNKKIPLQKF